MNRYIITALITAIMLSLTGSPRAAKNIEKEITITSTVSKDEKFSSACLAVDQETFEEAGFRLGDRCTVEFENGFTLNDVPYHNGYYVKNGEPVIVAYPGSDHVCVTFNNMGIWEQAELEKDMEITITLKESGKYAPIQEVLGQIYSFDRKDYESDIQFVNFRALTGGALKEGYLFRGASPVDNSRGRAAYTDALLREKEIGFILDLADSEEDMLSYMTAEDFASDYTADRYHDGHAALLDMGSAYQSDEYKQQLVQGLRMMLQDNEGPMYIHCMEGKDRTGFVCMLLEALAGATYDEMLNDYMITYANYYGVTRENTPEKYDAIADLYFDAFAAYLHGTEEKDILKTADYTEDAKAYLLKGGMNNEEIEMLIQLITK